MLTYDLAVIGSGAGLSLIDSALQAGLTCALVENAMFGGTCLTRGCIPSKILVHPADLIREAAHGRSVGLDFTLNSFDWPAITRRMRSKIDESKSIAQSIDHVQGLKSYKGTGEFTGPHTMRVRYANGTYSEAFGARRFVVAAGGRSFIPPIQGLAETGYVDAERFFGEAFPKKPWESLLIIGGGAIGAEFAHIFSAFGTKVSIVEMLPRLVTSEEETISDMLADNFRRAGIAVYTGHKALSARSESGHKVLTVEDTVSGAVQEIRGQQIFVAAGIRSNSDILRADLAGLAMDKKGWIQTNAFLQTSQPHIWALGDINGKYQFRHKANYEAGILINNLFAPDSPQQEAHYDAVPWAIFTYPQIAHVGMTQREAARKHRHFLVGVKHYSSVAKGFAMGYEQGNADDGFVKLIADEDMKILGVHIIGPQAALLIQSFIYLMNAGYCCPIKSQEHPAPPLQSMQTCPGGSFDPVSQSMVIHPSLSEVAGWAIGNMDWVQGSDD